MARPKSKAELLSLSSENYEKLRSFVDGLELVEQHKEFSPATMNRNIRDVLAHLHHWHLLMLDWYKVGMSGQKPAMPAKGYTWKTTSELNRTIREHYANTPLKEVKRLFDESYQQLRDIIESHNNEELFEKKRYKWTGSTSLGAYLVSATSSHYDWALKLIRKARK